MARILPNDIGSILDDPDQWSIFIYGDYGTGKTVLGAQAPGVFLIDTERSRRSLLNHPELATTPYLKNATYERIEKLVLDSMEGKNDLLEKVQTFQLDSVNQLYQQLVDKELIMAREKNQNRSLFQPSEAEWTTAGRRMRKLISMIQDRTDKNLILIGHIKEEKDDEGMTTVIRPDLGASVLSTVASLVDAMFYMSADTDSKGVSTRTLQTIPNRKIRAKNRFGTLPDKMVNPTFDDLLSAIHEQKRLAIEYHSNNIRS